MYIHPHTHSYACIHRIDGISLCTQDHTREERNSCFKLSIRALFGFLNSCVLFRNNNLENIRHDRENIRNELSLTILFFLLFCLPTALPCTRVTSTVRRLTGSLSTTPLTSLPMPFAVAGLYYSSDGIPLWMNDLVGSVTQKQKQSFRHCIREMVATTDSTTSPYHVWCYRYAYAMYV